jgi:hypothetical protein
VESCKLRYFNSFEFFDHTGCLPERKCPFSLIYATKLLLIKTGFSRDTNSSHLDALDDWTRQRLPVFRLRCACQQEKGIE